ncbi:MAG: hypothetical protein Q9209_004002 [Squamulea sp. 1 TL-2023]
MRKGRPHPTIDGDGQKKPPESAERPAKQPKITTEPDHTSSRPHFQSSKEQSHNTTISKLFVEREQDRQGTFITNHQRGASALRDRSSSILSRIETLSPSTDTSSLSSFSPSTKASTVSPSAETEDNLGAFPMKSNLSHQNSSSTDCSDCAGIAMQTLQSLTTTSTQGQVDPQYTLDTQLQTASAAIKNLSSILICPCSQNPDVGLLNAALCAAILDSYWCILRSSLDHLSPSYPPTSIPFPSSGDNFLQFNNTMPTPNIMTSPSFDMPRTIDNNPHPPHNQQAITQRVLDELPKAANVVMQFTRRYDGAGEATHPGDGDNGKDDVALLLPALAIEQRTRLQDLVDKATSQTALVA